MKGTVLIVDDDKNLLQSMVRSLRHEPYNVITASSGEEALRILDDMPVNVIVTDQDMPGMSGSAFLNSVKQKHPSVIRFMLTGKATLENTLSAINTGGVSRFFVKPCNVPELAAAIRQGIQQHQLTTNAHRLLKKVKAQSSQIKHLESRYPSITRVERDEDDAIAIDEFDGDIDQLLREIDEQMGND